MNMPYYVMLSTDKKKFFGSGLTTTSIINSLKSDGISARAYDIQGNEVSHDIRKFNNLGLTFSRMKVTLDSNSTFVLGTDKESREQIGTDLMEYFATAAAEFGEIDEIALRLPKVGEWLACVTLFDPAPPADPTFQVIALVGSSGLEAPPIVWTQEEKPGQLWTTHVGQGPKFIRDIKSFTGRGRWF
jgi:hypothetical protein